MAYTADDLIASVRLRTQRPDAAQDGKISDADILALANEEMSGRMVQMLHHSQDDFHVTSSTVAISASTSSYRIPSRALAAGLRDLTYVDNEGYEHNIDEHPLERKAALDRGAYREHGPAYVFEGDFVQLLPSDHDLTGSLKFYYHYRPGRLVKTDSAQVVSIDSVSSGTLNVSATNGWTTSDELDVVQATPNFDLLVSAATPSAVVSDTSVSFADVGDAAAGDYISETGVTPIVQLPAEMHPLLASAVVVRVLFAIGDYDAARNEREELAAASDRMLRFITPRNKGERKKVLNHRSPLRQGRKWRRRW